MVLIVRSGGQPSCRQSSTMVVAPGVSTGSRGLSSSGTRASGGNRASTEPVHPQAGQVRASTAPLASASQAQPTTVLSPDGVASSKTDSASPLSCRKERRRSANSGHPGSAPSGSNPSSRMDPSASSMRQRGSWSPVFKARTAIGSVPAAPGPHLTGCAPAVRKRLSRPEPIRPARATPSGSHRIRSPEES